jgi:hypothetical protein
MRDMVDALILDLSHGTLLLPEGRQSPEASGWYRDSWYARAGELGTC